MNRLRMRTESLFTTISVAGLLASVAALVYLLSSAIEVRVFDIFLAIGGSLFGVAAGVVLYTVAWLIVRRLEYSTEAEAYEQDKATKHSGPFIPLGGYMNDMSDVSVGLPEESLFYKDTEQWLRKYMPDLSDEQIAEELQTIYMLRLLEFYEAAIEVYPDLRGRLGLRFS